MDDAISASLVTNARIRRQMAAKSPMALGTVASSRRSFRFALRWLFPLTALAMLVAANPVAGQEAEWQLFGFDESGFVFEVPPGFEASQTAEQGRGVLFDGPNGALLAAWGADVAKEDFKARIENQMAQDRKEGWDLTYVRVTADWASYSGIREDQIRYVRAVTCGDRTAVFLLDYSQSEKLAYDPIVVRLVESFEAEGC